MNKGRVRRQDQSESIYLTNLPTSFSRPSVNGYKVVSCPVMTIKLAPIASEQEVRGQVGITLPASIRSWSSKVRTYIHSTQVGTVGSIELEDLMAWQGRICLGELSH
jgi:hypothetical protein